MVNAPEMSACEAMTPATTESTTATERNSGDSMAKKGFGDPPSCTYDGSSSVRMIHAPCPKYESTSARLMRGHVA